MTQQQRDIKRRLAALPYAEECGNVALTARRFGISRQCFYIGKRRYEKHGEAHDCLADPGERKDAVLLPCRHRGPRGHLRASRLPAGH